MYSSVTNCFYNKLPIKITKDKHSGDRKVLQTIETLERQAKRDIHSFLKLLDLEGFGKMLKVDEG